nr:DNA/RNA non-specific endonuclease [Metabacillus lacus]
MKRYEQRVEELKLQEVPGTLEPSAIPDAQVLGKGIVDPHRGQVFEKLIGGNDLFPVSYLESGLIAAKSVCRLQLRDAAGRTAGFGTGFLVAPSLLLTNHHVLSSEATAEWSIAEFNYELDTFMREKEKKSFRLQPDKLFLTDEELDFTLIAVEERASDGTLANEFGYLPLFPQKGKASAGEYVSIIQHPSGAAKAVAIRENKITDIFGDFLHYETDTLEGSSGSPVFNDSWTVVALHHAGVPDPDTPGAFLANEGIRVSSIFQRISDKAASLSLEQQKLVTGLIGDTSVEEQPLQMEVGELSKKRYETAEGYIPSFLGPEVPLPELQGVLLEDAAKLKDGGILLDYTHFSIVMSMARRLAFYTAVNIDGSQLLDIKRSRDKWYFDPRISEAFQCGPDIYEANDLDRGHLVRRRDPVWGEKAKEANEDTFHFTNCAPQHKHLNQKTWLDLENYLLNGAENHKLKVSVFTGPVFRDDDPLYRGILIPQEFWKVAVMITNNGRLSATAYLQSQKNLIKDFEFTYGEYKTYQVSILMIEKLTRLGFGKLKEHDPLKSEVREIQQLEHITL